MGLVSRRRRSLLLFRVLLLLLRLIRFFWSIPFLILIPLIPSNFFLCFFPIFLFLFRLYCLLAIENQCSGEKTFHYLSLLEGLCYAHCLLG